MAAGSPLPCSPLPGSPLGSPRQGGQGPKLLRVAGRKRPFPEIFSVERSPPWRPPEIYRSWRPPVNAWATAARVGGGARSSPLACSN